MGRDADTIQLPGAHVEGIAPVEELQVILQQDKAPLHPLQMHRRVLWKKGSITSWGGHTAPLFGPVLVSHKSPLFDPVLVSQYFNQSLLVTNLHYLNQSSTLLTKQASHKSLLFQAALVSPLL